MYRDHEPDRVVITGARESLTDDVRARQRRYLVSMGIRTVAFVAAVALLHGWLRWTGIVLALVLPWFAVVVANIGGRSAGVAPTVVPDRRALERGGADQATHRPVTVVGTATPTTSQAPDGARPGHTTVPPTAPGPDGPVELTTSRRT